MSFSPLEFVEKLSFVRYGGTPEERRAAESAANGVPVPPVLRETLNALAEELGCAERL